MRPQRQCPSGNVRRLTYGNWADGMDDNELETATVGQLERALEVHPADDLIIVDLDETLWLRNSTEAFLDHARPRLVVASLLALIDVLRPWRLTAKHKRARATFVWRDWLRVLMILILTPWNYWRWRRDGPEIARAARNEQLLACLERYDQGCGTRGLTVVASHGFAAIVAPLVQGLLPGASIVAASLALGWRQRAAGKWAALTARFDKAELRRALFLTDHEEHDADVVRQVARPLVLRWPGARFEPACARSYTPFRYTTKGKHAGRNYLIRVFLGIDCMVLMLASVPVAVAPFTTMLAYLFLILSFFVIFEIGYHENDLLGAEREESPRLTEARVRELGTMVESEAWCAAFLLALPGIVLLAIWEPSGWVGSGGWLGRSAELMVLWGLVLGATRGLFALFNRIDKSSRVLIYLPLQAMKGIGVVCILGLPVSIVGMELLIAQPIARWIPYITYRTSGDWMETPDRLYRLILFTVLFAATVPFVPWATTPLWPIALIFGWCLLHARHDILAAWRHWHLLKPRTSTDGND